MGGENLPDTRLHAHEGKNVYTKPDMFHVHIDYKHNNKHLWKYMHISMHVHAHIKLYSVTCQG